MYVVFHPQAPIDFGDRYRPIRCLKRTRRSVVYQAQRTVDGARVFIKCLAEDTPVRRARMDREALALRRARSPFLVEYLDFFICPDGRPALVTEYIEGQSLSTALREGTLSPQRCYQVLMQALLALRALHEQEVLHRDVAPQNIMLQGGDADVIRVRLVDLGFAQMPGAHKVTHAFEVVGSAYYMAPEQWFRKPLDARADLYGLGMLGLTMLRGCPLVSGSSAVAICQSHLEAPRDPIPFTADGQPVPELLHRVLRTAAQPEREHRYASAAAMFDALSQLDWPWRPDVAHEG